MTKRLLILVTISFAAHTCEKWPHLKAPAFKKARQEHVAQMVSNCDTIIEIGGAGAPMSGFIPKDKTVIVIDPKIRRKEEGNITHIRCGFEEWDEQPISKNYAVVILGLQLEMPDGAWKKLHALIDGSACTVIEYAALNKKAKKQFKDIKASVSKVWQEPQEIEIAAHELTQLRGQVFNHRILHCTKQKENEEEVE